jgi:HSP20 family protein
MLSVWDPFADLNRVQREFEKSFFGPRTRNADFAPAVDVHEDAERLVLRAELPGVKREDIEVSIDANVLTLKGERKLEKEEQNRRYHRIDAQLTEGVLTIALNKKQELKPRKIDVKS